MFDTPMHPSLRWDHCLCRRLFVQFDSFGVHFIPQSCYFHGLCVGFLFLSVILVTSFIAYSVTCIPGPVMIILWMLSFRSLWYFSPPLWHCSFDCSAQKLPPLLLRQRFCGCVKWIFPQLCQIWLRFSWSHFLSCLSKCLQMCFTQCVWVEFRVLPVAFTCYDRYITSVHVVITKVIVKLLYYKHDCKLLTVMRKMYE